MPRILFSAFILAGAFLGLAGIFRASSVFFLAGIALVLIGFTIKKYTPDMHRPGGGNHRPVTAKE